MKSYGRNKFVSVAFRSLVFAGFCVLCVGTREVNAAATYDTSVSLGNTSSNSISNAISVSGSDVGVVIGCFGVNTTASNYTADVDGNQADRISYAQQGSDTNKMVLFVKTGVSAGAHTVTCSVTNSGGYLAGVVASYSGVDLTQPDSYLDMEDSSFSYTTLNDNAMVVVLGRSQGNTMSAGTGLTKRVDEGSLTIFDSGSVIATAGSNSFSVSSGGGMIGTAILSLKSKAAGTPTPTPEPYVYLGASTPDQDYVYLFLASPFLAMFLYFAVKSLRVFRF